VRWEKLVPFFHLTLVIPVAVICLEVMMVFCAFTAAALQHASDFCSPWKLNGIPVVRRNGSFAACRE